MVMQPLILARRISLNPFTEKYIIIEQHHSLNTIRIWAYDHFLVPFSRKICIGSLDLSRFKFPFPFRSTANHGVEKTKLFSNFSRLRHLSIMSCVEQQRNQATHSNSKIAVYFPICLLFLLCQSISQICAH